MAVQFMTSKLHQKSFKAVQDSFRCFVLNLELLPHLIIEVFKQFATGLGHGLVDFKAQLKLKLIEGAFYFVGLSAFLVDVVDALFEVDTALDCTKHFIAGAEYPLK